VSSTTTVGAWIDLPTAGGSSSPWQQDDPLSSGLVQIAASNGTHAARVNSLRTLYEHPGSDNVGTDLVGGLIDLFPWDDDPSSNSFAVCAGTHRVRTYGETGTMPRLVLHARLAAPATYTAGLIFVARRTPGRPTAADLRSSATTTSTSLTDVTIELSPSTLFPSALSIAPRIGSAVPAPEPPETGTEPVVTLYVAAYRTGGSGAWKATLAGLTIYLIAP
jgi:hypothetical protein